MASEYTDNLNLDLYTNTDKPNLRDQYNAAMRKIDAAYATAIGSDRIADGAIGTNKIADLAVTGAKIADGTITAAKLADGTITAAKLADGAATPTAGSITNAMLASDFSVSNAMLQDSSVTESKIADGAVTNAKLGNDINLTPAANSITEDMLQDSIITYNKFNNKSFTGTYSSPTIQQSSVLTNHGLTCNISRLYGNILSMYFNGYVSGTLNAGTLYEIDFNNFYNSDDLPAHQGRTNGFIPIATNSAKDNISTNIFMSIEYSASKRVYAKLYAINISTNYDIYLPPISIPLWQ